MPVSFRPPLNGWGGGLCVSAGASRMLDGHSSFVRIVQLLSGWSGERDALVAAVDQYYAAVIHARSWPPELLERSRGINLRLATTNIANLSGTSDAAARVADELLWFAQIGIRRGQQGG